MENTRKAYKIFGRKALSLDEIDNLKQQDVQRKLFKIVSPWQ
jgi:hypothetical protein